MLAHHAMPNFRCRTNCRHKECQRHAPLGVVDQNAQCQCLGEVNASSIFLENVLDLANTLAQIMIICGIHECKAKSTVDVVTYAFLHYDEVCYCLDTAPKKRLRKEDLFHELGQKCLMNRVEAHLAYTIVKRGFKAFYYRPREAHQQKPSGRAGTSTDPPPSFSEECVYVHAARKTAEAYARYDGLSCEEQLGFEAKIKVAYKKYYDRMRQRQTQPEGDDCNCCFCAKKRGHLVYGKAPPCGQARKKDAGHKCPHCCRRAKPKLIHPSRVLAKCPKCHRSRRFCTCERYQFSLNWIESIWARQDFETYVHDTIDQVGRSSMDGGCSGAVSAEGSQDAVGSKEAMGSTQGSKQGSKQGSPEGSQHSAKPGGSASASVTSAAAPETMEAAEPAAEPAAEE